MKQQSVDVLDEATSFEQRMRWIMFKSENEAALRTLKPGWFPGTPLYPRPHSGLLGLGQQCIRPLFELFSYDDSWFPDIEDESGDLDDDGDVYFRERVRCMDCDVHWKGDEPCFVCGEVRMDPYPEGREFDDGWYDGSEILGQSWGTHIHSVLLNHGEVTIFRPQRRGTHDSDMVVDIRAMDPERMQRLTQQFQVYASVMYEQLQPALEGAQRSLREFSRAFLAIPRRHGHQFFLDEWVSAHPPLPEDHIRVGEITIPRNWEEMARPSTLAPDEDRIKINSSYGRRETPPWQRPITEQRRRREIR